MENCIAGILLTCIIIVTVELMHTVATILVGWTKYHNDITLIYQIYSMIGQLCDSSGF